MKHFSESVFGKIFLVKYFWGGQIASDTGGSEYKVPQRVAYDVQVF